VRQKCFPARIDSFEHRLVEPVQVIIGYLRLVCVVRLRFQVVRPKGVKVGADSHQFEVAALEKAANGSYQGGSPSDRDFSKIRLASVVCAESWASHAIDTENPRHEKADLPAGTRP
jgi:hypothetical protein